MESRKQDPYAHEITLTLILGRIFLLVVGLKPVAYQLYSMALASGRPIVPNQATISTLNIMITMLEICSGLLLLIFGWVLLDRICNLCINTARVRQRLEADDPDAKAPPV